MCMKYAALESNSILAKPEGLLAGKKFDAALETARDAEKMAQLAPKENHELLLQLHLLIVRIEEEREIFLRELSQKMGNSELELGRGKNSEPKEPVQPRQDQDERMKGMKENFSDRVVAKTKAALGHVMAAAIVLPMAGSAVTVLSTVAVVAPKRTLMAAGAILLSKVFSLGLMPRTRPVGIYGRSKAALGNAIKLGKILFVSKMRKPMMRMVAHSTTAGMAV